VLYVISGSVIGLGYLLLALHEQSDPHLWRIARSRIVDSQPALLIGASLAAFAAGIHLFYTASGPKHDQYDKTVEIYIASITASLGIRLFYNRLVPITDVNLLLKKIIIDLNNCHEGQLWIVYPALNIGYYRNRVGDIQGREPEIIEQYSSALKECAKRLAKTAHIITYPTDFYQPLYRAYIDVLPEFKGKSDSDKEVVAAACYKNAALIASGFALNVAEGLNEEESTFDRSKCYHQINPTEFPQHVIIIGSVTYALLSYGLPLFNPATTTFHSIPGEHKQIDILAYRREDSALALLITDHLKHLVNLRGKPPQNAKPDQTPLPDGAAK
jgi:hypothetical protein